MDRVGVGEVVADDRVAELVHGCDVPLGGGHDPAVALRAGDVAQDSVLELGLGDQGSPAACGEQRRFVDDVGEVGAGEAGRPRGQRVEVDLTGQWLALGVQLEDLPAPGAERRVDGDLAVEAAGPQERGVEDVGPVGGRDDDHAVGGLEAVHLDQQLVERLLALVVAAADARAAVPTDRVDLVDEDDRRRPLLGLAEEIADAARADADEHLDEVRSRDREERHIGFPRDRAREQRLARAGRSEEQHALGDTCADGLEAARRSQERGDLAKLLDRLLGAGDVRERRLRRVRGRFARGRAPEAPRADPRHCRPTGA